MNGNASGTAGLGADDAGGEGDHRRRHGISRAKHCTKAALEILEGSNRQDTAQARIILEEALLHLEDVEAPR